MKKNILSSWLREEVEGTERRKEMDKEAAEEESRSGKRRKRLLKEDV